MKKKKLKSLAVLVASVLMLSACANSATDSQQNTDEAMNVSYKNELNIAIGANPPTLDPQGINSNIVGGIGVHIYETLFSINANYEPTPVLAESYTVSDDGLVYTFNLRKGVKFHNGEEMVADDVVASMEQWLKRSSRAVLLEGSTFAKVDDYTITMTVPKASSDIMMIISSPVQYPAIFPASSVASAGPDGISEFIGTGPYKLTDWKQNQYVQLSRFEDYVSPEGESSGLVGEKKAATENIYFRIVTDNSTRIAGLQTGQYDIINDVPLDRYSDLENDENVKLRTQPGGTLNLFLNTSKGILSNPTLRQAVLAVLNNDDILMASYDNPNLYVINPGWFNPDDKLWASEAGSEYYNQNNQEKAKALMAEAGYNNEPIVLVTTPDYSEMYNATLVVQEQLRQAGFNAVVESYDFSTFMEHRSNADQFDLFITSNSYNPLPLQLSVLSPAWAGLDTPETSNGIEAMRNAASEDEAKAAWVDLQEYLYEYGAASVLGHFTSVHAMSSKVEGFDFVRYSIFWNVTVAE